MHRDAGTGAGLWQTRDQTSCSDKGCLLLAAAPCQPERCHQAPGWSGSACQPLFPMLATCLQPRRQPGHPGLHVCEVAGCALRCVLLQQLARAGACLLHHQHHRSSSWSCQLAASERPPFSLQLDRLRLLIACMSCQDEGKAPCRHHLSQSQRQTQAHWGRAKTPACGRASHGGGCQLCVAAACTGHSWSLLLPKAVR